ncbi:hypothetical protein J6590_067891 [Homalodisca vitripennis]|nr:hypothetical protein J6590_067891 [Homalodisca vitripennis]
MEMHEMPLISSRGNRKTYSAGSVMDVKRVFNSLNDRAEKRRSTAECPLRPTARSLEE